MALLQLNKIAMLQVYHKLTSEGEVKIGVRQGRLMAEVRHFTSTQLHLTW